MTSWELMFTDGCYYIYKDHDYWAQYHTYHEALQAIYELTGHTGVSLLNIEV